MDVNSDMYGTEKVSFLESSYQVTENQSIPVYADVQTFPCSCCGRCFNAESLRKHQPICKKTSQKQPRKVFDTGKQRAADSDVPYAATRETTQFYKDGTKPKVPSQKKTANNWREDHNALVRTIREARQGTRTTETSVPLPKHTLNHPNNEYIQCEFCQRLFNQYSAERHIPFCETQFKRKQMQYTATANNGRTPVGSMGRQGRINQQQHQTSSAPSTLVSRHPPKVNGEKDYRRKPLHANVFKRPVLNEAIRNSKNNTPPKITNFRMIKTRSAAGSYLPGTVPVSRIAQNGHTKSMATTHKEHHTGDTSPRAHPQSPERKVRSPSPSRRLTHSNGSSHSQQQKVKTPALLTAAKHCHECGKAFPVEWAKFCCECGEKRLGTE